MEAVSNNQEVVKLDFVEYLSKSFEYMHSCEKLQNDILAEDNKLYTALNILKKQYAEARENTTTIKVKSPNKTKSEFSKKIKTFFAKVWAAIVSLFEKIVLIVQSLIKSLIIFIQKKRVSFSVLIKHCDELTGKVNNSFADIDPNFYKEMINKLKDKKIRTFDTENQKFIANFDVIHQQLNNIRLEKFIKNNKVVLNNKKSIFNTNLLKEILRLNINVKMSLYKDELENLSSHEVVDSSIDDKLKHMEDEINALTTQAILSAEVGDMSNGLSTVGYTHSWDMKAHTGDILNREFFDLSEGNNVKVIANSLTYGLSVPFVRFTSVNAFEFLGFIESDLTQRSDFVKHKFLDIISQCKNDFAKICGTGGYIETISSILKSYNAIAKNDSANIKEIKKYIDDQMNLLQEESENNVFSGRLKRFTSIISKVNNVKTKFILLRQTLLSNLMRMVSIEDTALKMLVTNDTLVEEGEVKLDKMINDFGWKEVEDGQSEINDYRDLLEEGDESLGEKVKEKVNNTIDKVDKHLTNVTGPKLKDKIENADAKIDEKLDNLQNSASETIDKVSDYLLNKVPNFGGEEESEDDESSDYDDF